jgi:uncharacterized protein with predicted RNA binding PUA domain
MIPKENLSPPEPINEYELKVLRRIAEYQFISSSVASCLFPSDREFYVQRSVNTGKIRNVLTPDGILYLVLRAQDLLFSLQEASAKVILKCTNPPALRVVIPSSVKSFVMEGRSVFAKFVMDVDPKLRAGDEVVVVDENDALIAVGKMRVSGEEVKQYKRGVAVNVRRGAKDVD